MYTQILQQLVGERRHGAPERVEQRREQHQRGAAHVVEAVVGQLRVGQRRTPRRLQTREQLAIVATVAKRAERRAPARAAHRVGEALRGGAICLVLQNLRRQMQQAHAVAQREQRNAAQRRRSLVVVGGHNRRRRAPQPGEHVERRAVRLEVGAQPAIAQPLEQQRAKCAEHAVVFDAATRVEHDAARVVLAQQRRERQMHAAQSVL
jgi:hypothetical protein